MAKTKLIIDCDPGVDDAVALFLAFASPDDLDIFGITTVAGNVGPTLTARNACVIRQLAGRADVPVFAGCERPMFRAPAEAGHFHGESGLGSLPLFVPDAAIEAGHAVNFITETVMREPTGSVTLAVIGPMTNVAMAMLLEPRLASRLAGIVAMGGARQEGGNITASAEFNIYADPHAAQLVFASGCPIVVIGLDATHQVRATAERIAALEAIPTEAARATAELLLFSQHVEHTLVGSDAAPLHDPCVIAYLLRPELFGTRPCSLTVETASPLTLGHTAVEFRIDSREAATVWWVTDVDADGVFALLNERLGRI